ncbi:MAG: hypothetical protein AAGM33_12245, partial [Pseudomonadota bacterium]
MGTADLCKGIIECANRNASVKGIPGSAASDLRHAPRFTQISKECIDKTAILHDDFQAGDFIRKPLDPANAVRR